MPDPAIVELTRSRVREFIREPEAVFWVFAFPLLLTDAGALSAVERFRSGRVSGELILTPHAGEMATLWGCDREEVLARPLEIARAADAAPR